MFHCVHTSGRVENAFWTARAGPHATVSVSAQARMSSVSERVKALGGTAIFGKKPPARNTDPAFSARGRPSLPTPQLISLALLPCAGCLCPCLIPCDTREAYLMPGVTNHNGAKYVNKDECSHCGMGKCAAGTWQYEAEKKGSSGGGA